MRRSDKQNNHSKTTLRAKLRDQAGGSLIEFTLIAPLLFIILFGIIEFGLLLYDQAMITNASREGARAGIVFNYPSRLTDDQVRAVVRNYCDSHLISFGTGSALTITITRSGTEAGDSLTVRVNYPFQFLVFSNLIRLTGGAIGDPLVLSAESVMRLE